MVRVLIVDDSAIVRKVLTNELSQYEDIEVVGSAVDPYVARDKIVKLQPDVLTLDVEMPRMDGISFLAKLMRHYPMPVVVVSSLTPKNSSLAMKAFELGAVEVIQKPGSAYSTPDVSRRLIHAIRAASVARLSKLEPVTEPSTATTPTPTVPLQTTHKVIAIGASTGGTRAIETVLRGLPVTTPGTVIVQHMPKLFTGSFSERLNSICAMEVREARDKDSVIPGVVLVAPGDQHMLLVRSGACYQVKLKNGPPVHYHRPSVDVLFQSTARNAGSNAIGTLLTGMGTDGAKGLLAMREAGAQTIAQDEATSVVFGMPKEAIRLGAVEQVLPVSQVSQAIIKTLRRPRSESSSGTGDRG